MPRDIAYMIEQQPHQRSNFSVRKWEIQDTGAWGITPFAVRRQQGCQQLEARGIEAQSRVISER